jgi:Cu2+-exporting ATPase
MTSIKCDHCLLEFPDREAIYDEIDGKRHVFCCHGCSGIYRLIHEEGLDNFYDRRKWDEAGIAQDFFSREFDIRPFAGHVRDVEAGGQMEEKGVQGRLKEIDVFIDGIRCASCVWLNEKILERTGGIKYARVNYATHKARIRWDPEETGLDRILKRIISIGYIPKPYSESGQFKLQRSETRDLLVRFGTAAFLSSQLMIYSFALYAGYFQGIDPGIKLLFEVISMLLTFPVIFYSGMPFITGTLRGLRHLNFNMDSLICIGACSAFFYSVYQMFTGGEVYFDTSAMIITLILLGRYIEATAKGKASETMERLAELTPREARVIRRKADGPPQSEISYNIEMLSLSSIKKGDSVLVKPGERIPVDGVVVEGESEADESIITGESRPVSKTAGTGVIGGSMNLFGALVIETSKTGRDTVLAGIIQAVEDAQTGKLRIQTLADRLVGIFVPLILSISLLTVLYYLSAGATVNHAFMTGISVLVIACPCSLGLATPLAVLVFTSMVSSRGILIRGGEVIENTAKLNTVVFDKTGTITGGRPVLKDIVTADSSISGDEMLVSAASVEALSEHSLGLAITGAARGLGLREASDFRAIPGRGVLGNVGNKAIVLGNRALMRDMDISEKELLSLEAAASVFEKGGDTVVFMASDGILSGFFVVSDVIRTEAREVIKGLQSYGMSVSMISGDNRMTTEAISSMAGIEHALPETSPVAKKDIIAEMLGSGQKVMMVGDGINDAPALTAATVGVSVGRGTDIAVESADVVLVRSDLRLIPYFIRVAGRTFLIIKQNVFWAFFYNIVAVPLAVMGILHPIIAAGAMAASSLFVVINSLRIRKTDDKVANSR